MKIAWYVDSDAVQEKDGWKADIWQPIENASSDTTP